MVLFRVMLLCASFQLSFARDKDDPWWCHELDCYVPTHVKTTKDDSVELRSYSDSVWVSTTVTDYGYDNAVRFGFLKLFEYISGKPMHLPATYSCPCLLVHP